MTGPTILVVDDDEHIAELVRLYLERDGYRALFAADGHQALEVFAANDVDLVILDIMLPGIDGRDVCRALRRDSDVPIIMLSARGERYDRILGLELGADDYLAKPFDPVELLARIRAVLRRARRDRPPTGDDARHAVRSGSLFVDLSSYRAAVQGREVQLTPKELELLHHIARHPGRVFTRDQLLDAVWGYDFACGTRTVDAHVKRLRQKLGSAPDWRIATVWGVGYRFEVTDR